ncbi:MAG: substrate-binding domain-containing protein [Verrucomicrobia bacterium]|nr:substrate-binding domain-containing protein [Verrucomicrobiota bacterium]
MISEAEKSLADELGIVYAEYVVKKRAVALSFDVSSSYFREILAGVHRFAQTNQNWTFSWVNRQQGVYGLREDIPVAELDGLISGYLTPDQTEYYQSCGIPVVNISNRFEGLVFPKVVTDDYAVGHLAAEYWLNRGFHSFAFVGYSDHYYSDLRRQGFFDRLYQAEGLPVVEAAPFGLIRIGERITVYNLEIGPPSTMVRSVGCLLDSLRKPCAVFAANDLRARTVLDVCDKKGVPVPFEIAVFGRG